MWLKRRVSWNKKRPGTSVAVLELCLQGTQTLKSICGQLPGSEASGEQVALRARVFVSALQVWGLG